MIRKFLCFFGNHKVKVSGKNQYGYWVKCIYCPLKFYKSSKLYKNSKPKKFIKGLNKRELNFCCRYYNL